MKGKWIDEREDVKALIKMVEGGVLKLGMAGRVSVFGKVALEEGGGAFTAAEKGVGLGGAVFVP